MSEKGAILDLNKVSTFFRTYFGSTSRLASASPGEAQVATALWPPKSKQLNVDWDLLSLVARLALGGLLSWYLVSYMVKRLDPTYEANKLAELQSKKLLAELGLSKDMELSTYERRIAIHLVKTNKDGVDWTDIGGCDQLIDELTQRIILPIQLRSSNPSSTLLSPPKGILLYGPPGCGKTLLAKAIAKTAGARFINLQISTLTDMWYGESQKLAAAVFSLAKKLQPTIIFVDEIDSFLRMRLSHDHEATAMMKAQFMSLWDGFASAEEDVIIMGATNRPQDVDKAILRRMPARFPVPMPTASAIGKILSVTLKNEPVSLDVNFDILGGKAVGLSGSDLKEVCRLAVLKRTSCLMDMGINLASDEGEHKREITQDDLLESIERYRSYYDINRFSSFNEISSCPLD